MKSVVPQPRIYVALDANTDAAITALINQLDPATVGVKVGKEAFTALGPDLVRRLKDRGFAVFLDLKFHDIPNTVAGACRSAVELGVDLLNVHASGGRAMLQAALQGVEDSASSETRPGLIAVTVLTSMNEQMLAETGVTSPLKTQVQRLATLTAEAGLDGVVCSPLEASAMRAVFPDEQAVIVTPGVRPKGAALDDQQRVMTPPEAIAAGSSSLVIGRPITRASQPQAVVDAILASL